MGAGAAVGMEGRPGTATLERPSLLDPAFIRKLDMTTLSRESLASIGNILKTGNGGSGTPGPCGACARSKLPERFHTHPAPVAKPLPIKYKSGKTKEDQAVCRSCANEKDPPKHYSPRVGVGRDSVRPRASLPPAKKTAKKQQSARLLYANTNRMDSPKKATINGDASTVSPLHSNEKSGGEEVAAYCYICGKTFERESLLLDIHERECLARWHEKNKQLPETQRRQEPVKPDKVLVDVAGLDESFWQQHLTQLVPCHKCGRKFNPDRVKVHERSCKSILYK